MCQLAVLDSDFIMIDPWEVNRLLLENFGILFFFACFFLIFFYFLILKASQETHQRTLFVLKRIRSQINEIFLEKYGIEGTLSKSCSLNIP